jgi:hypothetical protein
VEEQMESGAVANRNTRDRSGHHVHPDCGWLWLQRPRKIGTALLPLRAAERGPRVVVVMFWIVTLIVVAALVAGLAWWGRPRGTARQTSGDIDARARSSRFKDEGRGY